ncbi:helix-turn-helix transcriptional regulator [Mycobacteroides abscessus]|uniref:helix-turn-helix transcriptional regulator n=1 Tax=Mycobacteroides abscessus TaxID=36809 RepID=UPI0009A4E853|nr:helix-turn-helix transcriptional regulator [Mycobacteroides abscessus]
MTQESEHDRWLSVLEKRIGKSVSSARGDAMVSQEELARRVGWSRNGVANLETGRASNPRVSVLLKIAAALDVPPMRLLFPNVLLPVESCLAWLCLELTRLGGSRARAPQGQGSRRACFIPAIP